MKTTERKKNGVIHQTQKQTDYLAFFDAEYTCYMDSDRRFDRSHSNEVLSVGLVISDKNYNVIKEYYSPIRPVYNNILTGYCKSLTHLTQSEIDTAPSYEVVFDELYTLLTKYPVKEIYTWGNDYHTMSTDLEKNHKVLSRKSKKIVGKLKDITRLLTLNVFGKSMTLSLSDMKYVCGMDRKTVHNALADAKDLYRIVKCCQTDSYDKERKDRLFDYLRDRDEYHRSRRFKQPFYPQDKRIKEISKQYIRTLKEVYRNDEGEIAPEILALCDDVRNLMGEHGVDCPKLK